MKVLGISTLLLLAAACGQTRDVSLGALTAEAPDAAIPDDDAGDDRNDDDQDDGDDRNDDDSNESEVENESSDDGEEEEEADDGVEDKANDPLVTPRNRTQ